MKAPQAFSTFLSLAGANIIWGGSFIAGKAALDEIPPFTISFARFFLSALILVPLVLKADGKRAIPARRDIPLLLFLGFSGAMLYNVFALYALKFNPAGETSLLIAVNPILISVAGSAFLGERLNRRQVAALALAFLGTLVILTRGDPSLALSGGIRPHQVIILGAPLCWAAFTVAGRIAMRTYSPLASVAYTCVSGSLMILPFAIPEMIRVPWRAVSAVTWGSLCFLTLFVTVAAFIWWYKGVQRVGASRAAIFVNLVPLSGVLLAAALLKEPLSAAHIVGAAMVIGGVLIDQAKARLSPSQPGQYSPSEG